MKVRILVGLVLLALFLLMFCMGGYFQLFVISLAMVLSTHEMGAVLKAKGKACALSGAYLFSALQYLAYVRYGLAGQALLLGGSLLLSLLEWCVRRPGPGRDLLFSLFLYIYPLGLYGILSIVMLSGNRTAYLLLFAGPLMGDTLAYFVGTLFGKHKLCPRISPKKTVEGSVAGFAGGLLGGFLAYLLQPLWAGGERLLPLLLTGLLCGGVGEIGDLWASAIKRWAKVKDYGSLFPGHGGVMDRLDSVLMCAPVVLLYMLLAQGGLGL